MDAIVCPLCRSTKTEARYDVEIPTIGPRKVAGCGDCAFHFITPRPSGSELEKFYAAGYFRDDESGHGYIDYSRKVHARWGEGYVFGRRLRRWMGTGRVIELGCGTGDFLAGVVDASGWSACGIDLSEDAIEAARRSYADRGIDFRHGSAASLEQAGFGVDVVVARDVIEHLSDPASTLSRIRKLLRVGGRLWMQVPNGHTELAPFARANRQGQRGTEGQAHLNYFLPGSFRAWMVTQGWSVDRAYTVGVKRGLFCLGYLPWGLKTSRWRTASKRTSGPRRKAPAVSRWKRSKMYARLRYGLKYWLKLPLSLPFGQELVVLASKTAD